MFTYVLQTSQSQPSTSAAPSPDNALNVVSSTVSVSNPAQEEELMRKREMVAALSNQTGMNLSWSEK